MKLPDISDYKNIADLPILFFAILTVDVVVLFLTRYFPQYLGKSLNNWYNKFGLSAVLADVLIILIGFVIARYIYTIYIKPNYGWNPLIFMTLVIIIQAIHDILFFLGIINILPRGHNEMIDVFKDYSEAGTKIIVGDSALMIGSGLFAFFYKSQPTHIFASLSILVSYALPYILYKN